MQMFPYRDNARYNVGRSGQTRLSKTLYGVDDAEFEYQHNSARPSAITDAEAARVQSAVEESLETFAKKAGTGERIKFALSGEVVGLARPFDRTIEVPCMNAEIFDADFVRHIQRELLTQHSEWRVLVAGDIRNGEEPLVIYPSGVCAGETAHQNDTVDDGVSAWNKKLVASRNVEDYQHRQQETIVTTKTAQAVTRIERERVIHLEGFDNSEGDDSYYAHWFLFNTDSDRFNTVPEDAHVFDWIYQVDETGNRADAGAANSHSLTVIIIEKNKVNGDDQYQLVLQEEGQSNVFRFVFRETSLIESAG